MTDEGTKRRSTWLRRLALAPLALLIVIAGFLAQTWTNLPKRTAERFLALLHDGKVAEAAALVDAPSSIAVVDDGALDLVAADGSRVRVLPAELPLVARKSDGFRMRSGLGDHLAGRFHFQVTSATFSPRDGRGSAIEVDCLAVRERIVIESTR